MPRTLGAEANEPLAGGMSGNGRIWIKNLEKGNTRVRFCQPTSKFYKWYEHYMEGPGAFACDNDPKCPGCTSDSADEQRKTLKYGFNVIKQDGRLAVHKIGVQLFEKLQRKEQFYNNTLLDRDWVLIREGERLKTEYDAEAGEKYPVEFPERIYNLKNLVFQDFYEAMDAFEVKYDPMERDEYEECYMDFNPDWLPQTSSETKGEVVTEQSEPATEEPGRQEYKPSTWPLTELKEYLTQNGVDFPDKAPKSRLVTLADAYLAENPPFSRATT